MGSNSSQRTASTHATPPAFDLFSSNFQPPPVWCRWLWDVHFWSKAKVNTQLQEKVRKSLQQRDDGTAWGFKDAPCLPYGWGSHQISAVFASQPFWLCLISHQFQIRAIRRLLLIRQLMLPTSCQNSAPTRHEEAYSVAPRWRGCLAGSMQGWLQFTGCQIQRAICRLTSTIPTHFRTGQATSLSTWNEPYWKWVHRMRSIFLQYTLTLTTKQA